MIRRLNFFLIGSLLFSFGFFSIVAADSSTLQTSGASSSVSTSSSTTTSEVKNTRLAPEKLLGVRIDFVYNDQNDMTNTLRLIVYLIENENELFNPVYKADASKYKVSIKGSFYVGSKTVYTKTYITDSVGEIAIYLDQIPKIVDEKKGKLRVELEPLKVGSAQLSQMKYHDRVYREFSLPIPSHSTNEVDSVGGAETQTASGQSSIWSFLVGGQKASEGRTMTSILVEAAIVGVTAILLGYFIGRFHGKQKAKKQVEDEKKAAKFRQVPPVEAGVGAQKSEEAAGSTEVETPVAAEGSSSGSESGNEGNSPGASKIVKEDLEATSTAAETGAESAKESTENILAFPQASGEAGQSSKVERSIDSEVGEKAVENSVEPVAEKFSTEEQEAAEQIKALREQAQKLLESLEE